MTKEVLYDSLVDVDLFLWAAGGNALPPTDRLLKMREARVLPLRGGPSPKEIPVVRRHRPQTGGARQTPRS